MSNKKITVSPIKGADLSNINTGEVLKFEKTSNATSSTYISVSLNGTEIGYVADTTSQLITGTSSLSDVWDDVPNTFTGVVDSQEIKVTGKKKVCLVVEISTNATVTSSNADETTFIFKVAGSTTANPGKSKVIGDTNKGNKTFVSFKVENDKIVCFYEKEQAGVVSVKNESGNATAEEREVFKEILATVDPKTVIEGKVIGTTASSYNVQVSLSKKAIQDAKTNASKKAIGGIKQPLIDKGFDEKVLNDIETYLLDNGFNVDDIMDIFATYEIYPDKVKHLIPTPKKLFKDENKTMLYEAYSAMAEGFNILCSGEKGTGKNVFVETWAWILQRPLMFISINRETDKTDLLGSKTIEPVKVTDPTTGEKTYVSKIVFQKEILLEAMEYGCLMLFDEINFAEPGVTGTLHSIGDDRKEIFVPGYGLVKAHRNFLMMATMNVGYQGTMELNEALGDRFVDVIFDANDSISDILELNAPGASKTSIALCDKVYKQMLSILRDADASLDDNCLTVRGFIQAIRMSKRIDLKRALIMAVANKVKDTEYRNNIIDIIETIVH